jgi:Glycosyltransferase family 10 (fucosyltransferase) C-term
MTIGNESLANKNETEMHQLLSRCIYFLLPANQDALIYSYSSEESHLLRLIEKVEIEISVPVKIFPDHPCPDVYFFRNIPPLFAMSVIVYLDGEKSLNSALFGNLHKYPYLIYVGPSTGVPYLSQHFTQRKYFNPVDLLVPSIARIELDQFKVKDVGYLSYNCEKVRDRGFLDLKGFLAQHGFSVDQVGRCPTNKSVDDSTDEEWFSRYNDNFLDQAVYKLLPYKIVLAFENDPTVSGYVTEKIANAFLAGSVPVYFGDKAVLDTFNEEALIYVSPSEIKETSWMQRVLEILQNPQKLHEMLSIPPVKDPYMFSWHPDVPMNDQQSSLRIDLQIEILKQLKLRDETIGDPVNFAFQPEILSSIETTPIP